MPSKCIKTLDTADDYRALFLRGAPLLDVRAPVEFAKGAFPGAVNAPLMDDGEREQVGICYQRKGQQAAIALGHELVSGAIKARRIAAWVEFARAHPDGYLYCFRGGLRSQISQTWLRDEGGIAYPRITGGYKAMRGFLLEHLDAAAAQCRFTVLGGMTGTGKSDVLRELDHALDLEHHAHHRGSSFGKHASPQPTQINFENALSIDLLKKRATGCDHFVVEDESPCIGHCSVPRACYLRMQTAPVVWLRDNLEQRVSRIQRDYVVALCAEFVALHGPQQGLGLYAARLRQNLDGIARRLGAERHRQLAAAMDAALAEQARSGTVDLHRQWIAALLTQYYDPMYAHQRERKAERIVFEGDKQAVLDYLKERV